MSRNRFLCTVRHALPASLLALMGTSGAAWAQTAPVFDASPAASTSGAVGGAILLDEPFDFEPEAGAAPVVSPQAPTSSAAIGSDEGASTAKALAWKYVLGREAPRLSWQKAAPVDLSSARSVGLRFKSDQPTAIEVWFETEAQGEGAASIATRYSTTAWSVGGSWQGAIIDRARFVGHEVKGGVPQAAPIQSALWDAGWSHIARWGVADASNTWLLFAGQVRAGGARTLRLDDLKVTTATAPNAVVPAPAPPKPAPQPAAPNTGAGPDIGPGMGPDDGDNAPQGPDGFEPNRPTPNGFDPNGGQAQPGADPRFNGYPGQDPGGNDDGDGGDGNGGNGGDGNGGGQPAPETEVQAIVQDAWGDVTSWIPINGTTAPRAGERGGLKWSMVRLANRDAMLISVVNPDVLRSFPPESLKKRPRDPNVVIQGAPDRLLRLAIAITSAKPTVMQVALHESGGGVWTALVPIDPRRPTFVPVVRLADFINAPTRRDANGQIDLDHIVAVSLQDLGAQKSLSGPNDITLRGMTWIY